MTSSLHGCSLYLEGLDSFGVSTIKFSVISNCRLVRDELSPFKFLQASEIIRSWEVRFIIFILFYCISNT